MSDNTMKYGERDLKRFGFRKVYIPQFKTERAIYDNGGNEKTPWVTVPTARMFVNGKRVYPESYEAAHQLLRQNSEMLWNMVAAEALEEFDTPICERIVSTWKYYGDIEQELAVNEDEWCYADWLIKKAS